jgi:hypothetical protein
MSPLSSEPASFVSGGATAPVSERPPPSDVSMRLAGSLSRIALQPRRTTASTPDVKSAPEIGRIIGRLLRA